MIMVDYKCPACGAQSEALVQSPAPSTRACSGCGSAARRRFTTAGLIRLGASSPGSSAGTDCFENPDVPGLCHVGPAAKKTLIARYRRDDETLKAEQSKQTAEYELHGPPPMTQVASHSHPSGCRDKVSAAVASKISTIAGAAAKTSDK